MSDKKVVERLSDFINAIGASRALLQRANESGFLIEGLVLYAAMVDGFCRIALVLKQQIKNKSADFDIKYIYQDEDAQSYYTERAIYKLANEKYIIEKELFDEVNALYDVRNKAIHQFLISEIEYAHLGLTLERYELVFQRLYTIVYSLETEQIHRGIGMTISGKISNKDRASILNDVQKKINTKNEKKLARILGKKLITNPDEFSESNERSRISDEISDEIEIQEEKRRIPPGFASVKEITQWAERRGLFKKCICGHEKIHHIDRSELPKDGGDPNGYISRCGVKGCKCKKYNE